MVLKEILRYDEETSSGFLKEVIINSKFEKRFGFSRFKNLPYRIKTIFVH